jgi:hypothetical protein
MVGGAVAHPSASLRTSSRRHSRTGRLTISAICCGTLNRRLSQEEIDRIVVAQADDDSAWEKPIYVRREKW